MALNPQRKITPGMYREYLTANLAGMCAMLDSKLDERMGNRVLLAAGSLADPFDLPR